jgi:triosephosphate isomerase
VTDARTGGAGLAAGSGAPRIRPPVFEMGLKGYLYGADAVRFAVAADRLAADLGVTVVFDPQHVDIAAVARETVHLLVFAQHMDPVTVGRGVGYILPEALREAGAVGTLLNHAEHRLALADIATTIRRARELGMATVVCADSPEEAAAVAMLGPDVVLAEPPDLIATDRSAATEIPWFVERSVELVHAVDPAIVVMCGAGVRTPDDAARMIALGVGGTGSTSGILKAPDPVAMLAAMLEAVHRTWTEMHPEAAGAAR